MAKPLSDAQVMDIRRARWSGDKMQDIADRYGISKGAVSHIVKGNRYAHLPLVVEAHDERADRRAVRGEDALRAVRKRWADGEPLALIAESLGVTEPSVKRYVDECPERGPEWERVMPDTGARYRNALLVIAQQDNEAGAVARQALGI